MADENEIKTAPGSFLDSFLEIPSISREYYGGDETTKPNDHCVWRDFDIFPGWHETDAHLIKRRKESLGE